MQRLIALYKMLIILLCIHFLPQNTRKNIQPNLQLCLNQSFSLLKNVIALKKLA